jgi:catechol 2,3-dioxygenase-like lactoylglutathione lyase family enzyme
MQLERLDHVSLNVTDRARSVAWYRDVLGLPQRNQPTADDEPVFLGDPGLQLGLFQAQTPAAEREPESAGFRHPSSTTLARHRSICAPTRSRSTTRTTATRDRSTSATPTVTRSS